MTAKRRTSDSKENQQRYAAFVISGRNLVEKETGRRPAWKVNVHVEDGVYLGIEATTGEVIVGEPERRVAHKNGPAEDSERKMGTKQPGDDRGGSVAQERRRRRSGRRTSRKKVVTTDKDNKEKLEMEEHVPVPKRVYTRKLGGVLIHSEMCRVHIATQGDGETSAHRKLSKAY